MSEGLIKEPKNVELEHTLATRKGKKKKKVPTSEFTQPKVNM